MNAKKAETKIAIINNNLKQVNILKNSESINYSRNENGELIGIEKSKSADIEMYFENKELTELRKLRQFDGKLYTEEEFPKNARRLRGFDWREDERPNSVEDLFSEDPPLNLPKIKGLEPYKDEEEFFNDDLIGRVKKADQEAKDKNLIKKDEKPKASRNIPKQLMVPKKLPPKTKKRSVNKEE